MRKLVVSAESLRDAESVVADLIVEVAKASPAKQLALTVRLDFAIRHLELLQQGVVHAPEPHQTN